jgi:hypothetical protein
MRCTSTFAAALALAAVVLVTAALWLLSMRPGVTSANANRITAGADLAAVEALMGGPEGVHTDDLAWALNAMRTLEPMPGHAPATAWVGDDGIAWVNLDGEGRVVSSGWLPRRDSVWDVIRRKLGW